MIILHSSPVLTLVAIACNPSFSSHSPNSFNVSVSICSNLSRSTKPQSGLSFLTIAVDTFICSAPLMLSHLKPLYVSSPSSTDNPSSGRFAFFNKFVFSVRTLLIAVVSSSYLSLYSFASSSALSLSIFARTLMFICSMFLMFCSSSSVDSSCKSSADFCAISRSESTTSSCD